MMNAPTTRWPIFSRAASPAERPEPCATTVPETSWPSTHGVGKRTSSLMTCRSVWQTPHASTRISTSPDLRSGVWISSTAIGAPMAFSTTAFLRLPHYACCAYWAPSSVSSAEPTGHGCPLVQQPLERHGDAVVDVRQGDLV